jgi:hypothetical protein
MTRIQLRLYIDPGEVEITFNVRRSDQIYERVTGVVDTGASVSLLPNNLLSKLDLRPSEQRGTFTVEQAGIAKQAFEATEAYVTLFLEDQLGQLTQPFEVRVWFAETDIALIGFADILKPAVLHIDMPQRTGWLEIDR